MTDVLRKLSRAELRNLTPGVWVAWRKTRLDTPDQKEFAFWEAQVIAHPVRSGHDVMVLFDGVPHAAQKNRLYKVQPVIDVKDMHQQFDYNS
jgi:hypothetical protein